jgi:hypothetical protein
METGFHNPYCELLGLNGINNSTISLSNAVTIPADKFFAAGRSRIIFQGLNSIDYAFRILLGNEIQFFNSGSLEKDIIIGYSL